MMEKQEREELERERARLAALVLAREREYEENSRRLRYLQQRQETLTDGLVQARRELRELRERLPERQPRVDSDLANARGRQAAVQFEVFTLPEFATVAGISITAARQVIKDMLAREQIRDTGQKFGSARIYEYVRPDGAGRLFEAQQRVRAVETPVEVSEAVAGTGANASNLQAFHKDVRIVVRQAMQDGWELRPKGDGHFDLTRGEHHITVATTPGNPSASARVIRDKIRRSERKRVAA